MNRKARIAIAFTGCHRRGGVERVMLEASNYLAERGHDTHAFAINWDADAAQHHAALHRHTVNSPSRHYILRNSGFIREVRKDISALSPPPDIQVGFGVPSPLDAVLWIGSVHRRWIETSASVRGLSGRIKQRLNPAHAFVLNLERQRFGGRQYRKLVAVSDGVKADLTHFYNVPEQDVEVITNGYQAREFTPQLRDIHRPVVRAELGISDSDRAILFVANELERKGFAPLLRAVASINDSSLHIIAVGRLNAMSYAAEISELGMTNRVHWTGPRSDVARYYAAADLFVLPTQYEAWGLVIVEALGCGIPVVTSRLAGASIAVEHGNTGVLLQDPNRADEVMHGIQTMLNCRLSPEEIAASVSQYRWENRLHQFEQLLFDCMG